jgi:hypothetical protein
LVSEMSDALPTPPFIPTAGSRPTSHRYSLNRHQFYLSMALFKRVIFLPHIRSTPTVPSFNPLVAAIIRVFDFRSKLKKYCKTFVAYPQTKLRNSTEPTCRDFDLVWSRLIQVTTSSREVGRRVVTRFSVIQSGSY